MRLSATLCLCLALLSATPLRAEPGAGHANPRNAAVRRGLGAALLAIGAVLIPTSLAWYLPQTPRPDAGFAAWQVSGHALGTVGGILLLHGQRTQHEDGPRHPASRGLRIFGSVLVAAAGVLMPIGVLALNNDLGGGFNQTQALDAGIGILSVAVGFWAGGTAMVGAGAYYASPPSPLSFGASPILRQEGGAGLLGAMATMSGRF